MTRYRLSTAVAALAALGVFAPAAMAGPRYASPQASGGGACTSADPCALENAIENASSGEEVILKPGTYSVTNPVDASEAVDIHGQDGQAVPRLIGASDATEPTLTMSGGGSISRVFASSSANSAAAFDLDGVIADGIEAKATNGAYGIELYGSVLGTILRNSVSRADNGGAAVQVKDRLAGASTTIIGVTALGTNGADGVVVKSTLSPTTVKNTIARGTYDVEKKQTALAPVVSYSNFRPASSVGATIGAGNQSAAPLFASEATGDLRPVAGSPTIDAAALMR